MRKGIGKIFLFAGFIFISSGIYFGYVKDLYDEWTKDENPPVENNNEKTVDDSLTLSVRKKEYLNTGSTFIRTVSAEVTLSFNENLELNNSNVVYYIPVHNESSKSCVQLERGGRSPFGEWEFAYVIVTVNDKGLYSYGFTALDKAGYGFLPAKEDTADWDAKKIDRGIVPIIPKMGGVVTKEVLSFENRTGIKAIVATVNNGVCIVPNI